MTQTQLWRRFWYPAERYLRSMDRIGWIELGAAALLLALLVFFVARHLSTRYPGFTPRTRFLIAWAAEAVLILAVLAAAIAWGAVVPSPFGFVLSPTDYESSMPGLEVLAFVFALSFVVLGGIIILSRFRMPPSVYVALAVAWVSLWIWAYLHYKFFPMLEAIVSEVPKDPVGRQKLPDLLLPGPPIDLARIVLWALASFLAGIYFVRRRFAWWKLALGSLLCGWLLVPVIMPVALTANYWLVLQPIAFTAIGVVLLSMPIQRSALERLFALPLRNGTESQPHAMRLVPAILGHAVIIIMIIGFGTLAVIGHFDRRLTSIIEYGPPQIYRVPAERDAYPFLQQRYVKRAPNKLPDYFGDAVFMANGGGPAHILDTAHWGLYDTPKLRAALKQMQPYFDDFTSAAQCDYVRTPPGSPMLAFLPMRETARNMHTRAMLKIHDGDTTGAAQDIASIIGFGGIMKDYPILVTEMIGSAIRGIGCDAAYKYYTALRHNTTAMDQLARVFDAQRENTKPALNIYALREGEPGMGHVSTYSEFTVPAFLRADMNLRGRYMQFQQLEVAVALERYKARHGSYPATLDPLVPEFLHRLPIDPYEGKPYKYAVRDQDFTLTLDGPSKEQFEGPLQFPPETAEAVLAREKETQAAREKEEKSAKERRQHNQTSGTITKVEKK